MKISLFLKVEEFVPILILKSVVYWVDKTIYVFDGHNELQSDPEKTPVKEKLFTTLTGVF